MLPLAAIAERRRRFCLGCRALWRFGQKVESVAIEGSVCHVVSARGS